MLDCRSYDCSNVPGGEDAQAVDDQTMLLAANSELGSQTVQGWQSFHGHQRCGDACVEIREEMRLQNHYQLNRSSLAFALTQAADVELPHHQTR